MSTVFRPILLVIHDENLLLRQIAKMTSEVAEMITLRRRRKWSRYWIPASRLTR